MSNQLKRSIQKAFAAPKPDQQEKARFLRTLPQPQISLFRFIFVQASYVRKISWVLSGLILLLALFCACNINEGTLWVISAFVPILGLLAVTEGNRSMTYGMSEFEMSARFSLKSVVLARMSILGLTNFAVIAVIAPLCRIGNDFSLLERINNNIRSIEMLQCKRMDYSYLNRIIGNSTNNIDKKILLIGAGSLGSYVASELVKNGFNNITLYDGDDLVSENFMRWYYSGIFKNSKKANQIKFFLELMHPEIHVDSHNEYVDGKKIVEELISADYIIFTIGSSDAQLWLNRVLQENGCKATVLYAWLEAGGQHSHILKINYNFPGCYECLFTNDTGDIVNNQANLAEDKVVEFNTIHNGCGATRAAYGTSVLLRTTSVLLDVLNKEETEKGLSNYLVNITPESVMYDNGSFIKEVCHRCGN